MSMDGQPQYLLFTDFMNRLLSSERSKVIIVIGLIAIGVGFTAKNVISYPTECTAQEMASS